MGILDRRRKGKWPSGRKILSCYGHGLKAAVVKQRLRGGVFSHEPTPGRKFKMAARISAARGFRAGRWLGGGQQGILGKNGREPFARVRGFFWIPRAAVGAGEVGFCVGQQPPDSRQALRFPRAGGYRRTRGSGASLGRAGFPYRSQLEQVTTRDRLILRFPAQKSLSRGGVFHDACQIDR